MRFAAAKVMSRPDFTDMVPRVILNTGALSGTAGNPNIDPYRATQEDLSLEWYPNKDTAYTLALYNKNLKNFIVDNPDDPDSAVQRAVAPNALCTTVSKPISSTARLPSTCAPMAAAARSRASRRR